MRWWLNPYVNFFGNALGLAFAVVLAWACLNAVLTGEIGFGKSSRVILEKDSPATFWLAFWFQLGLAAIVIWASPKAIRKDVQAIRELRISRSQT
jgi:hypothetical protein